MIDPIIIDLFIVFPLLLNLMKTEALSTHFAQSTQEGFCLFDNCNFPHINFGETSIMGCY